MLATDPAVNPVRSAPPLAGDARAELLGDAFESLDEGFILFDADDRLIACNARFREIYGFTEEECAPGTLWVDLVRRNIAAGRYTDAIGREGEFIAERQARRDGDIGTYEIRLSNGRWIRASDRRTKSGGIVSLRADITDQKQAEQRRDAVARETEDRLREIVAANPVPMTITRVSDGLVVYCNQRAADMVRTPLDQVIGAKSVDFYADDKDRDTVVRLLRTEGRVELLEVRFKRGDGTTFPLALMCRPIMYAGEPAIVTGFHDLSDWKRMEAALHQSEKMAALGSLLAGVAHELNNPLTVVVTHAVLLEEMATDERAAARAEKIRLAAERCSRIVRTFLALARQRQTTPSLVQMNDVVTGGVDLLGYQLRTCDVQLTLDLADDLPAFWADADQLNQVVTNLIVNAVQAMTDQSPPRRLSLRSESDGESVRLIVTDNGPGVSPEIRSRIFEPFFTTKDPGMGTGIGLSMCLSIVTAHGGTITVSDSPGGGATFTVALPLRATTAEAKGADAERTDIDRAPARILIVDDEPDIREALVELLKADRHQVEVAENGAAALDRIGTGGFDAVISDLRMPVMDGPGLYRAIEQRHPALASRIGFVTGDSLSPAMHRFLTETKVACLEKPFTPQEVKRLVAQLLPASG